MSRYIRLLNSLKLKMGDLEPTPNQIICINLLTERLKYPGIVNLFGLHGVGKTFLGWFLVKSAEADYFSHPSKLKEHPNDIGKIAFVDNVNHTRIDSRQVSINLEEVGYKRAIIVTTHPMDDYIFRVELNFTDDDLVVVRKNLSLLSYTPTTISRNSLWQELLDISMR